MSKTFIYLLVTIAVFLFVVNPFLNRNSGGGGSSSTNGGNNVSGGGIGGGSR